MASQSAGINTSPAASTQSHVDGQLYSIIPELQIGLDAAEISNLPALELALYYAQTAKFRTYPLYHLFEETDFSQNLHCFYQDPSDYAQTHGLWYVHYLVIMALGKSLLGKQAGMRPAGSELFSRALNLLPDAAYLSRDPVRATELFCSVALYLHCVDHRVAAHSYIGQAVRMAQSHGLHTDMPPALVGDRLAQHGRLLWWTAYTLDRRLSSLMGTPNTIHNEDISAPLPRISDSDLHSAALSIHVKIAKTLGSISITVYGPKEKLKDTFLSTIRRTLKCIGELGDELASFSSRSIGEISRVAAHLNLQYNQIANILLQLKKFNLLDDFLPFDLETAYSAAFVLIMSSEIEAKHPLHEASLAALLDVFDTMVAGGNLVASSRKAEVEELDYSLRKQFCQNTNDNANSARALPSDEGPDASLAGQLSLPSPSGSLFEGWSPGNLYTGSRIEGLADSLTMDELNDLWV
ncbi:unnamed protein product [Clonostachys rosea f. rosea IK726]|uniref:Uncharacterized protein n=1 Tax=Clonostachys rosea f. rosea IK726 TaxID=1349383 RepID=A0ACA9UH85_BIOOC|nr:unnamed protein product [Clonostachys rosea f. rosea IK726]